MLQNSHPAAIVPHFPTDCALCTNVATQGEAFGEDPRSRMFFMRSGTAGYILYGPYIDLPAGQYVALFAVRTLKAISLDIAVVSDIVVYPEIISPPKFSSIRASTTEWELIAHKFSLYSAMQKVEMRLMLPQPHTQTVVARAAVALRRLPDRSSGDRS